MVIPGKDKTEASFQEDQSICQQHASTHTGPENVQYCARGGDAAQRHVD
jgi:hypothetical protein